MVFKTLLYFATVAVLLLNFGTISAQPQSGVRNVFEQVYYITASPLAEPCPVEVCLNLTQFASNTDYYLSENVTLLVSQGNHHLNSQLIVANVSRFSLIADTMSNDSNVAIVCNDSFTIENVSEVYMNGLSFVGCTNNHIKSVKQLFLDSCSFDGLYHNGTALNIVNTTTANITGSWFKYNNGSYHEWLSELNVPYNYYFRNLDKVIVGGAIIGINSSISIHNSKFMKNSAQIGGAMFIEQESELFLSNCEFHHNNLLVRRINTYFTGSGSAIFACNGSSVVIRNCIFENTSDPTMIEGYRIYPRHSGVIDVYYSTILIQGCIIRNNSGRDVIVGYYSNITFMDTIIEHNDMLGIMYARNFVSQLSPIIVTSLESFNCTFYGNIIQGDIVVCMYIQVQILTSSFINNHGRYVINADYSNTVLTETVLENNIMMGCISVQNSATFSKLSILNCTFFNNLHDITVRSICIETLIHNSYFIENHAPMSIVYISALCSSLNQRDYNTTISESTFERNIGYNIVLLFGENLTISETKIINNSNEFGSVFIITGSTLIDKCTFDGNRAQYGTALFAANSSVTISDSVITNNIADVAGILLIIYSHLNCSGILILNNVARRGVVALTTGMASFSGNTTLINNMGSLYAVGSEVIFKGNVNISNCSAPLVNGEISFEEGGGVTIFQSVIEFSGKINLMNNDAEIGGAMFISESRVSMSGDITVANNYARQSGGGIYLYKSRLNFRSGRSTISENKAIEGGVYGVSSTITLEADRRYLATFTLLTFISNTAMKGGALFMSSSTKIYNIILITVFVHQVYFIENTAEYGGAVYIADQTNLELCNNSNLITTPSTECFIQIFSLHPELLSDPRNMIVPHTLNFTSNYATFKGNAIFGGLFDRCTIKLLNPTPRNGSTKGLSYLKSVSNIDDDGLIASHPVRLCFCNQFDQPDCSFNPLPVHIKKGKTFKISVVAVDQVGHVLKSVARAFLSSNDGGLKEGQLQQSVGTNCTDLTYNVITPHDSEEIMINAIGPCGDAYPSQRRVQLIFANCSCPIGFQLSANYQTNCNCECHSNLTNYVLTETCNTTTESFQRKSDSTWISYTNISRLEEYYLLIHQNCPYDYCLTKTTKINVSLGHANGVNKQCDFNRADTLCGACQPGFSVSFGSSRCIRCHKHWPRVLVGLILLAALAGIGLVCVLLFLNLTVAIGTINGILFYANIINGNASIFFKDLPSPSFPSVFIAWLNLDIGFDVCLYEGIDTYSKTWLQLVFPIYLISLVVIVIIISKYSQRFSNVIGKRDPVATLATLILISYSKLLSIAITILSLTTLEYPDGNRVLWKPDATIQYLEIPKHVLLFIVALIILILGATYTNVLFYWQIIVHFPDWKVLRLIRNPRLSSVIDIYHTPYNSKHRYWTGLLLLIRVILYLVSALNSTGNPQVPLIATSLTAGSLLVLDSRSVYKNYRLNILEIILLANILAFALFTWYATDANDTQLHNFVAYVSVMITFVLFFIVIIHHVYVYTKFHSIVENTQLYNKLKNFILFKRQTKTDKPLREQAIDLHEEARDVDIFELVDESSDQNAMHFVKPVSHQSAPTVSTVEIPKPKEEESQIHFEQPRSRQLSTP